MVAERLRWQRLLGFAMLASGRKQLLLIVLGVVFIAAHLPFLARTPGTIDSVNFSLGIQDFNVVDHRPHPPGYPVFIALGKLSRNGLDVLSVEDPVRDAARALAIWSALFGALSPLVLFQFFRHLEMDDRRAVAATVLAVTCPLFWFNAARPMSDIPGLVVSLAAQMLLVMGFRRFHEGRYRPLPSSAGRLLNATHRLGDQPLFLAGAAMAGIAIGFRLQNAWLTLPLLTLVVMSCRPRLKLAGRVTMAFAVGLLLWLVPLLIVSGGPARYKRALEAQGYEDLFGADMLFTHPTSEHLSLDLLHTFAYPWATAELAALALVLGLVGAAAMLARSRTGAILLAAAVVPYAFFHLMFQESIHTRYALPLVPAMAYLAVRGVYTFAARAASWLVGALAVAGVLVTMPPVAANARVSSPVFQALDDIRMRASRDHGPRVLGMHHALARMLRDQQVGLSSLPSVPKHEWLALVRHWQLAPDTPVWFLAETGRDDLALIDPSSRRLVKSYSWSFPRKFFMGRVPASGLEWYEITPPGWMAAAGWSLTPEAGGVAFQDRREPGGRPIAAFVRRRRDAAVLMVGGSNLSGPAGPTARLELSINGRPIDSWEVGTDQRSFLRMWELPAGTLAGPESYQPLQIQAWPVATGVGPLRLVIQQFDLQSTHSIVYGFGPGWFEQESDVTDSRPWRWSGPSGTVRVHHAGEDLTLHVVGEVPLKHLAAAPRISVRAGHHILMTYVPHGTDVDFQIQIPANILTESGGLLTFETDQIFVPDEVMKNGDRRRLGLRVYHLELHREKRSR